MRSPMASLALLASLCACEPAMPTPSAPVSAPVASVASSASPAPPRPAFAYPAARLGDLVDDYRGVKVPDPYRWLEELDAPETRAFIAAQNRLTDSVLAGL